MKFILGKKVNMSQIFSEEGRVEPVTIVSAGPMTVTQVKKPDTDGYCAVQVGFGQKKENKINKAQKGHLKDLGSFAHLKEFRLSEKELDSFNVGDSIDVSFFENIEKVKIAGTSKGKGFQGGVKRHGFSGDSRTHGQRHTRRQVGSVGATGPQRIFKGKRMPGRMGADRTTVKNLKLLNIDKDNNLLIVRGALPGPKGALLEISSA